MDGASSLCDAPSSLQPEACSELIGSGSSRLLPSAFRRRAGNTRLSELNGEWNLLYQTVRRDAEQSDRDGRATLFNSEAYKLRDSRLRGQPRLRAQLQIITRRSLQKRALCKSIGELYLSNRRPINRL